MKALFHHTTISEDWLLEYHKLERFTNYHSVGPLQPTEMASVLHSAESNADRFLTGAALIGAQLREIMGTGVLRPTGASAATGGLMYSKKEWETQSTEVGLSPYSA